jgi:phosphatidylglycerophosphate synthase
MKVFDKPVSDKMMFLFSVILGAFIIYPRIIDLPWELPRFTTRSQILEHVLFFIYRYLFFSGMTMYLISVNIHRLHGATFGKRILTTFAITAAAYIAYVMVSLAISKHVDCFTGLLLFQFIVACLLCSFTGHVFALYTRQRAHEREIEQLKTENLQSRYEALANQINPHFFFNSLNGLAALVRADRKPQTLKYISELSGVFRYILQSDRKGLVQLQEELQFLDSFRYLQEIRYADKLSFDIRVPEDAKKRLIPALSLLPLIENIVKHNVIDSEHPMQVSISVNAASELTVSNPVHAKIDPAFPNGIGLRNLSDRFDLLLNRKIIREESADVFTVRLPLS